jgi:hypothetical protein
MSTNSRINRKQVLFRELFVGSLLYAVVLGFFNDYTDILHTRSYSVTFSVAIVMQTLTYFTFELKDTIVSWFQRRRGWQYKAGMAFTVWLIMFSSKFVYLAVISLIFPHAVEVRGFVGLLLIIICTTVAQKLADLIYERLAD